MGFLKIVLSAARQAAEERRLKAEEKKLKEEYELELSGGLTRNLCVKIAEKHGLAGKIAFKFPKAGPIELIILLEDGKGSDLPGPFLKDLFRSLCEGQDLRRKDFNFFKVVTMEKSTFDGHIEAWNSRCAFANSLD
ncbi:MAG: hypothetical protein HY764_02715 [Candidatus Portnoybacteria bacterium]|nr:hypothetical protein [Candidatus Portnoybacteria bacterium]